MNCLRKIYDASFWKSVRQSERQSACRWTAPMLALGWLAFSLCEQRALTDRFTFVRQWLAGCFDKRRRPGTSYQGFTDASRKCAAALLAPLRARLRDIGAQSIRLKASTRPVFAIDGSMLRVPHTRKNVAAFGKTKVKGRTESGPQLLAVAAVELESRMLWDWEIAGGKTGEPELAMSIIERLPPGALVVKDAGTVGYEWLKQLFDDGRHILMRVGGNFHLWARQTGAVLNAGGEVWLWPENSRGQAPLKLRLIKRTRKSKTKKTKKKKTKKKKHSETIYLLTDLAPHELSDKEAGKLYFKRWGASEIGFRGLKQTLEKRVLLSRTPEMVLLECDYALLGLQLLSVMQPSFGRKQGRPMSLARTWRAWRESVLGIARKHFQKLLVDCVLDKYTRRSKKIRRRAPQQKRDYTLKPPKLRKLTNAVISRWQQCFPLRTAEKI